MSADEVSASKNKVLVTLVMILVVVAVLAVAYLFLGGDKLVADLLGGTSSEPAVPTTPAKPSAPATSVATPEETPSTQPTETASAEETATEAIGGATSSSTGTSGSGGTTKPAVNPPTGDQAARMYWEQVASQEQIGKLVRGEIKKITVGTVTRSGSTANVRITVTYTNGSTLSGTMVLRDYNGVWYFSSIARDGNPLTVKTGSSADLSIVSTIVEQQASNQAIVSGIVSGAYKSVTLNSFSGGSGTQTIGITVGGGTASPTAGSIVCVSKTISGNKYWFITSFTKN